MKRFLLVLIAIAALNTVGTSRALAQPMDSCQAPTIQSLQMCVQHAATEGFITNQGVTQSLLAKLDAAQAAVDRNQPAVAVNLLGAFIHEVEAQAGQHSRARPAHGHARPDGDRGALDLAGDGVSLFIELGDDG